MGGHLSLTDGLSQLQRQPGAIACGINAGQIGGHVRIRFDITAFQFQTGDHLCRGNGSAQQKHTLTGNLNTCCGTHAGDTVLA